MNKVNHDFSSCTPSHLGNRRVRLSLGGTKKISQLPFTRVKREFPLDQNQVKHQYY